MTAKTDFLGQYTPLHQIYGQADCCLCRLEKENAELKAHLDAARETYCRQEIKLRELRTELDNMSKMLFCEGSDHQRTKKELDEARKVIEICHEVGCQTATDYLASHTGKE